MDDPQATQASTASSALSLAPGVRIVAEGPALNVEDVADRLAAIADTYDGPGDAQVAFVDGHSVRLFVDRGALVAVDGVAEHRRDRTFSKVSPPERLVVTGDGVLTTDALRWCHRLGVAVVVLGGDQVLLAASPPGRNDPRLRRAQALAADGPAGLAIVRHLLTAKLRGQASVLRQVFNAEQATSTLDDLAGGVALADSIDEARQLEAVAAATYFAAWAGHPATAVGFVSKDRGRVPPHWCTFDSRRSAITGAANTNRLAERPLNSLMNLLYKLAEVEARFALVRLGLDPGLGVLHADAAGRDSLALDLIEPVRPAVDRFALELVAERSFRKSDFVERSDGHVRVSSRLAQELATTMPTWRRAVAPHAEKLVHLLAEQVAGKLVLTTPLTGAKTKAAAAQVRKRKAEAARARAEAEHAAYRSIRPTRRPASTDPDKAAVLFAACIDCGGPLARSRHVRCPSCWEKQPAQSREARRRRGRSIAMARSELDRWRAENPNVVADPQDFEAIRARLVAVKLPVIMAACGVSKTTASGWRSGRHLPALRHWPALAELAGVDVPA